jgi:hypothetical protein
MIILSFRARPMTFSKNVTGHSDGISIVKDYLVFVANLIFIVNNAYNIYIREGPLKEKKVMQTCPFSSIYFSCVSSDIIYFVTFA